MKAFATLAQLESEGVLMMGTSPDRQTDRQSFHGIMNGHKLVIHAQGDEVATMRVSHMGDHDDPQQNYLAGSFLNTLPEVFAALRIQSGGRFNHSVQGSQKIAIF